MATAESKQGGARVRLPPPLVFLLSIGTGVALRYLSPLPSLPLPRIVAIGVGAALGGLGLAIGGAALGLFKKSGQDVAPWTPSPSLLLQGVYKRTRNPMYVGMTLVQSGLGLALGNLWVLLLATVSLAIVHFTAVLPEEAYLTEKFGDDYRQYKSRVRRYL
jgi:protein-S-isoprenylcysteine O-methyltransferase Ste14